MAMLCCRSASTVTGNQFDAEANDDDDVAAGAATAVEGSSGAAAAGHGGIEL